MASEAEEKLKNVVQLSDILQDGSYDNPELMLLAASKRAATELPHVKKAVVIFFNEESDVYSEILWSQCGLNKREMLKLISLAKDELLIDNALNHKHG